MITELEFKSLAALGYNRIPLIVEAFADLETPLSLYLKLVDGAAAARNSFLLESVVGGERFGRYSFIGLPARTLLRSSGFATEVVTDGAVVESDDRQPARFHRRIPAALQGRAAPGAAALLRRTGRLLRLRHGALHRAEARALGGLRGAAGSARHARHHAAAVRRARGDRQPLGPALPDRLCRPRRARGLRARQAAAGRARRQAALQRQRAGGAARQRAPGRARLREGRLPRRGAQGQGLHRRRRHDAGADRPASEQALHRVAAEPLPRAAFAESVAVHVLLRHGRVPDRRRVAGDPGAPRARRRRRQGDDPAARRHAAARRDARAGPRRSKPSCRRPEGARRAPDADRPRAQRHRPDRARPAASRSARPSRSSAIRT